MIVRAEFGTLFEVGEEAADPIGDGVVPFDLAGPAALDGVLGELVLAGEPGPQARGVLTGREELRGTEVDTAMPAPTSPDSGNGTTYRPRRCSPRPSATDRRRCDTLTLTDRDQYLVLFTAPPGSPGAEALALLNVLGAQASHYLP